MQPANFPQANIVFGPPEDMAESQVARIPGYAGTVKGGSVDGAKLVVVAWLPTQEELKQLMAGSPIYLSVLGGLPPHFLTTDFNLATQPA